MAQTFTTVSRPQPLGRNPKNHGHHEGHELHEEAFIVNFINTLALRLNPLDAE
jgi:hypothetical protein